MCSRGGRCIAPARDAFICLDFNKNPDTQALSQRIGSILVIFIR